MEDRRRDVLEGLPVFEPGWVWLVGAGPGDPGLLTLHAANALAQADVVIYDALVDPQVLSHARPGAAVEYAGKRGGKPSPKQRDISLKLIALARGGKRVCRLKGGDPFVFGRGGEEALALVEAGIPFRVVPGITAGIGGPAYAGIPVTHRDTNQVVTFITGHDQSGLTPSAIDWESVAKGSPVIVLYMAVKHLAQIAAALILAGRNADEATAIISQATTSHQQVIETSLGEAAAAVAASGFEPPAIVVVGEVVRFRAGLDWLGALAGRELVSDPLGLRRPSGLERARVNPPRGVIVAGASSHSGKTTIVARADRGAAGARPLRRRGEMRTGLHRPEISGSGERRAGGQSRSVGDVRGQIAGAPRAAGRGEGYRHRRRGDGPFRRRAGRGGLDG